MSATVVLIQFESLENQGVTVLDTVLMESHNAPIGDVIDYPLRGYDGL